MGLFKAAAGAIGGTLADQWKEFFTCDSLSNDVLFARGYKQTNRRTSNTDGHDNVITQGSAIAVADGQCAIIVDQGVVTELAAEPGVFTYDKSSEPSIFAGGLKWDNLKAVMGTAWERFKFGGDTGKDQRLYYFNIKEILDNKFGTATPVPFRVVDRNTGLDIDVSLRCNGIFTFKIDNPITFYTKICGNVADEYKTEQIRQVLKTEFISALQPAFAHLSDLMIRPNAIPSHVDELCEAMNQALSKKWGELRGLSVVSVAINSISLPEEDAAMIKKLQLGATMRDPGMAAAQMAAAQADAMRAAASNPNGAAMGLMGMGMVGQFGGGVADMFRMQQMQQQQMQQPGMAAGAAMGAAATAAPAGWTCECGTTNQGKFCANCGKPKPAPKAAEGWTCECGAVNQGKFCMECGKKKPAGAPTFKCDKCGYVFPDPKNPGKFCPECGDPVDDNDIVK